jgi:DNA repair protein SbcC/Rad50
LGVVGVNPLRVHAEHYRSFRDLDLELPSGCCAVVGANGAGKSSIVNVVDLCLFGPTSRTLADYLSEDAFDEDLVLCLEFEHRGELYKVRRTYSPKGRGQTKVDFEQATALTREPQPVLADEAAEWSPLTRETAAATQALIEETIGLSRETFRASAFLAQGDGAAFTAAQPRDRKRILAEVLNLSLYDRLLECAKADRNKIESESATISARTAAAAEEILRRPILEGSKAELDEKAEELARRISGLEEARKEAADKLASAREAAAELKGAREVLATREAELVRVQERVDALTQEVDGAVGLAIEREGAQRLAETIPALEQELTEALAEAEAQRELTQLEAEAKRLADAATPLHEQAGVLYEKAAALERQEDEACDRCGQPLHDEARARATASYLAEANRLQKQADAIDEQVLALPVEAAAVKVAAFSGVRRQIEIQPELDLARVAATRVGEIAARLERLDELKAERELHERNLPDLRVALAEQQAKVDSLLVFAPVAHDLEQHAAAVELQLNGARDELAEAGRALAGVERDLERITELEAQVANQTKTLNALQAELDVVLLAERAYGRDGIPALILENAAIPQIELEASRILSELGTSFTVELRTQRELKGGGLAEALDIVVCSEGAERPLETFSGGERSRIVVALRIALARLLAHRRGAEVRMLVLDEVEYLDEPGMAALVSVLQGLVADFERVIVVSHVPALRDAFDNVIEVVKGEDGRSRIEGAVEAEAVAV